MTGLRVATQQTTLATVMFGRTLQTVMIKSVIGIALVAIGALIAKIMELRAQLSAIGNDAKGMRDLAKSSARMGDVEGTKEALGNIKDRLATFKELQKELKGAKKTSAGGSVLDDRGAVSAGYEISTNTAKKLIELGVLNAKVLTKTSGGYSLLEDQMLTVNSLVNKNVDEFGRAGQNGNALIEQAIKKSNAQKAGLQNIDLSAGDGNGKPPKEQSLESYYSLQDQLAKNFTQAEIDRLEAEHQHKVDLIKAEYDLKEARANSFQREALKFERRMAEITLERQGALLKASNDVLAAQGSVAGGAGVGGGAGGGGKGLGAGIAQYITGDPSSPFYRADHGGGNYHEHLAFVSRQAAEEAYKKLTSAGIQVTEFKGKSRVGRHTPGSAHYEGLAFDVPGAQVPVGRERELTARVQSTLGIGGARPAPVPASQKRDIIADQKVQIEQAKQSVAVRQAEAKAIKDAEIALADFIATATPVEEQKLQNDLLKRKTELMMQGYSDTAVDQALKFAEAEYKVNFALKLNDDLQKQGKRTKEDADAITKQMTEGLTAYSSALKENSIQLRDNQLAQAMTVLKDRMSMAGAITPDQELREQIRQKNPDFTLEQQEGLFQQEKMVQGAEKLKADLQGIAGAIGDSFGEAFKGMISGSMTAQQALANLFQSVGNYFADMVAKMIAEWLKAQLIKGFANLFGSIFGGGGGDPGGKAVGTGQGIFTAANGGIATGGFRAFANGGVVSGPTMGLVGEGRYNEAIVPLPDGKSIPVQLAGGDGGNQIISNITVNVNNGQAQSNATGSNSSEMGRKIEGAVKQVIVGELRPGGLLASKK